MLFTLVASCRLGGSVQPIALRGPAPESIAIWPVANGSPDEPVGPLLLAGLDAAALRRGYMLLSHEVTATLVFDSRASVDAAPSPAIGENDLAGLGRRLNVDAILVLEVRRFESDTPDRLRSASWDLRWELQSTRGHGVLWSFEHNGSWRPARDDEDPLRPLDAEPGPATIGSDRPPHFRDLRELSFWLNRHAMEHLPSRSR